MRLSTFAWVTITGELKRFYRNTAWAAHVPRSLRTAVSLDMPGDEAAWVRFEEGLSQSQIAARAGLSQMHVSRLLAQALGQMREARASSRLPRPRLDERGWRQPVPELVGPGCR